MKPLKRAPLTRSQSTQIEDDADFPRGQLLQEPERKRQRGVSSAAPLLVLTGDEARPSPNTGTK